LTLLLLPLLLAACGPKVPPPAAAPPATAPAAAAPAAAAPPAPAPLVYFAMVDRFANGDATNDHAIDPADPHAFHGGDLQGVIDHLDHLERLGVTHLWLSPVFEMRTDKIGEWGAFHGYWVRDLARVEPRFGDEATLRALADALHARDMKLVLDMVWNHTDYDAPLLRDHPDWFHDTGDIIDWDDPTQRVTGRVHGLPDLAQERPAVARHLAATSTDWIDRVGVDGFRVDAVGHMPLSALAQLNARLDAHRPGFWTLGEDFTGDPERLSRTLREGAFDAVFDFPLRYAAIDVFCHDAPLGRLASTLSLDRLYDDPTALVTFLDNHDLPRVTTECGGDAARVDRALAFLFSQRGVPSLTWGTEVGLPGGEEPDNRRDQPWEAVSTPEGARRVAQVAGLTERRAAWPVLQHGNTVVLHLDADRLVLGRFTRTEAAVIDLSSPNAPPAPPPPWLASAPIRDSSLQLQTSASGTLRVQLLRVPGDAPPPWADYLTAPPAQRLVVTVPDGGEGLRLVGAGPELGHWDPSRGVPFVAETASVELPGGTAAAFKVVRMTDAGVAWPDGPDTVTRLPWAAGETRVDAAAP